MFATLLKKLLILIQQSENLGSAQVQVIIVVCGRFLMARTSATDHD